MNKMFECRPLYLRGCSLQLECVWVGFREMGYLSKAGMIFIVIPILLAGLIAMIPSAKLPFEEARRLAQSYHSTTDFEPLRGKIAIVTGSTSGLGKSIASELYELGATVVIASRSSSKCEETILEIQSKKKSNGKLIAHSLDVSDLDSVKSFATWFLSDYSQLDILVNNAGINYLTNRPTVNSPSSSPSSHTSAQGYDLTFASNYLGHFLLTELVLSVLIATPNSRIVSVSSGANYLVNGSALALSYSPPSSSFAPLASFPPPISQQEHAYSNSKLAQILHIFALQKRVNSLSLSFTETITQRRLQSLSCQPGFTLTPIIPSLLITLFGHLMYSPEAASMSTLWGLFDVSLSGSSFLANTPNFWYSNSYGIAIRLALQRVGLKTPFMVLAVPTNIILQQLFYGKVVNDQPNSVVFERPELSEELYQWSYKEIEKYL